MNGKKAADKNEYNLREGNEGDVCTEDILAEEVEVSVFVGDNTVTEENYITLWEKYERTTLPKISWGGQWFSQTCRQGSFFETIIAKRIRKALRTTK